MSLVLALVLAAAGPRDTIEPAEVREIVQKFATCAVRRRAELASKYVLDPDIWLEKRDFRQLFDPDCVPTDGRGHRAIAGGRHQMRFALAEALVRREFPSAGMVDVIAAAPLDHTLPPLQPSPTSAKVQTPETTEDREKARTAIQAISKLGECVVRSHPNAAYGLLWTDPGSDHESRYLEALQPAAGNCIEKGAAISLTKYSLRGAIALSYYRLSKAPRNPEAVQ